jgi:hypothetical protein
VFVEVIRTHQPRSRVICRAMVDGLKVCGVPFKETPEEHYCGPTADIAVFYGLHGRLSDAFIEYRRTGRKAVYVDLGFWCRTAGGKLYGYHKVAVNSRHPTAYFQNRQKTSNRFAKLSVPILPWRKGGRHILVAGMGAKASAVEGFKPTQWEEAAIREIRRYSDRPIIYRPKPSWRGATPIDGTIFDDGNADLNQVLGDCHAVVSHHSNVCVDAILAGIPAFCWHGVAVPMSLRDLTLIETPLYLDGREEWAWNIAYTQWRPDEMSMGDTWRYLQDEGVLV